jgi:hypothetical protein
MFLMPIGRGSFEVARGSSAEPPAATSGVVPGAHTRPTSSVVSVEGVRVSVGRVVAEPVGGRAQSTADVGEAPATRRVAVYLKVRNEGQKVTTFTPLDVALRDVEGEVYVAYNPEWSRSPALPGSALEPGGRIEGWRVFDVPAAGLDYVLLYRPDATASAVEARLPRLRSGVDEAPLEQPAQLP